MSFEMQEAGGAEGAAARVAVRAEKNALWPLLTALGCGAIVSQIVK